MWAGEETKKYDLSGFLRGKMGWMTGLEPATAGTTIQCSTIELHPPFQRLC